VKIGIKIKFSIFLGILLLLTVVILSLLVLNGIKNNQKVQYEQYLAQQAETANIYFMQNILAETNKVPQTYLKDKGIGFAAQLELISGLTVVLYDINGTIISKKTPLTESKNMKRTLDIVLNNKTAYLIEGKALYYFTPIKIGNEQVGVVQFNYSLTEYQDFYKQIRQLFIYVGAGVFLLSFILAYIYFGSFANGIIRLKNTVDQIGEGHYDVSTLRRRDELGRLSKGIQGMSSQIEKTLQDMKEEQEKLTLAVDKLSLLDQQQKQFIGNVTHEFKTPLTSIKAYLDLLEMYPEDNELLETAKENIKSETQKLYEMVVKVLDLSALDKYEFEYRMEPLEVKQTILAVLNSLSGKLDKFGIQLVMDLSEVYVKADKDSMMIILMNLLDNAIKYNKAGGSIFVRNYESQKQAVIEIADTGIGIPNHLGKDIFEPFYTVDKNRSRENGGVGLGLSLAKKYAEVQGGSLTLVKSDQAGTTFRITFPVSDLQKV
jgi:two-component system, OmpR family, phosphate regulon sensor histidine kinase PhoR